MSHEHPVQAPIRLAPTLRRPAGAKQLDLGPTVSASCSRALHRDHCAGCFSLLLQCGFSISAWASLLATVVDLAGQGPWLFAVSSGGASVAVLQEAAALSGRHGGVRDGASHHCGQPRFAAAVRAYGCRHGDRVTHVAIEQTAVNPALPLVLGQKRRFPRCAGVPTGC